MSGKQLTSVIIGKDAKGQRHVVRFWNDGTWKRTQETVQDVAKLAGWLNIIGAVFHGQHTEDGVTIEVVTL